MSNMIIIVKKVKCPYEHKHTLIKISDMLKKPLKKLAENTPKKPNINQGGSFSMFLQPIDQQYSHIALEEHPENPTLIGRLDLLNYSTDSSEEFQKKAKESQNKNIVGREEISARRRIPLQSKKGNTFIKELIKQPINSDKFMTTHNFPQFNPNLNKGGKNNHGKLKFTKLLNPGWEINVALDKNKSLQKLIFHIRGKFLEKRQNRIISSPSTSQINFGIQKINFCNINKNNPINYCNRVYLGSNSNNVRYHIDNKVTSNYFRSRYNINNNKSIIQNRPQVNDNKYFTCNEKVINHFPSNKVCKYKHNLKVDKDLINKIKYRRPLSVD